MAEEKKGRGCFFYGCITLIVLVIIGVIAVFFGVRYGVKVLREKYTAAQPVSVAPLTLSTNQGAQVTKRVDDFKKALQGGTAPEPLELTADELDYFVRNSAQAKFKNSMHLAITNDRIRAQLSFPLDGLGPTLQGRFFNGEADFGVGVRNGLVAFDLSNVTVAGQPVPPQALQGINQNLNWQTTPNDPNAVIATNLSKVEIKDGKIVLYPKAK